MSINIYRNSIVYVAAPANAATGGPELLHQLVYHLRNELSINAYMYYYPNNYANPIHEAYTMYNNPYVTDINDDDTNILIIPEVYNALSLLTFYTKIRNIIWWLSVDNYYTSKCANEAKVVYFYVRLINKVSKLLNVNYNIDISRFSRSYLKNHPLIKDRFVKKANYHLVQSAYGKYHLREQNIKNELIFQLSDYLNDSFLEYRFDPEGKDNIVAYNPAKGLAFTRKIIRLCPFIKFVPIQNMTRKEVIDLLKRAKVYVDFGNHPGKDRLPREAAISGCCVILGKRGSAKFAEDVPIPEEYKFEDCNDNIANIFFKIRDCLDNYDRRYSDFNNYRKVIRNEPENFVNDLKNIFVKDNSNGD
jgi:hypothetical protein